MESEMKATLALISQRLAIHLFDRSFVRSFVCLFVCLFDYAIGWIGEEASSGQLAQQLATTTRPLH